MAYKFFRRAEFACKCGCGQNLIEDRLLLRLDAARELAGIPFKITSGYRCPTYNDDIGGVQDSAHVKGLAADIAADSKQKYPIISALISVGFVRIGVAKGFIHADVDLSKPQKVIWTY